MAIPISQRIARYMSWLRREPVDRPLIGHLWEPDIPPLPAMLERTGTGVAISPEDLDPELFLPLLDPWYRADGELCSDTITPFTPAFGMPWVEAIAGCPVIAHPGSLWAAPTFKDYANRPRIRFDPQNPWFRQLMTLTRAMVKIADGRFPIALPQMRGPLDVLTAMRTPEQMGLDLIEQPEEALKILDEIADLWIAIAENLLEVIPPFHGGYCSRMKMWAPGPTITPQNDTSALISPRMYERFALPLDRRIMSRFPYHLFHMHSTEYHQVSPLLQLESLAAIQFTLEHTLGGPPLSVTLPVARRILEKKPLLLACYDFETAEQCMAELPHAGLAVMVAVLTYDIPKETERWLAEHCSS